MTSAMTLALPEVIQSLRKTGDTPEKIRARIVLLELESASIVAKHPHVDGRARMPVHHQFTDGLYIRTVFIPKGLVVVGKIHRHEHLNFLEVGDVTYVTEFDGVQRIHGPLRMISKAGTKRALFTHTDAVWTTVHVTNERDLEKLEAEIIAPCYGAIGMSDPVMLLKDKGLSVLDTERSAS